MNCMKCKHYVNTWKPSQPRACRFFGFKSKQLPSDVVYETTGERCTLFEPRPTKKQAAKK
ncbi:MAG: uracil-DNA glycosylase [Defluviitaleaceae bacterium]|nr:uracil-DNA glycosylase [Defluviitaleaceae bacterium]